MNLANFSWHEKTKISTDSDNVLQNQPQPLVVILFYLKKRRPYLVFMHTLPKGRNRPPVSVHMKNSRPTVKQKKLEKHTWHILAQTPCTSEPGPLFNREPPVERVTQIMYVSVCPPFVTMVKSRPTSASWPRSDKKWYHPSTVAALTLITLGGRRISLLPAAAAAATGLQVHWKVTFSGGE